MNKFDKLKERIEAYLANIPKDKTADVHSILADLLDYADDIANHDNNNWVSVKKHGLPKENGKYLVYNYADDDVWTSDFCVDLDKFNFHHENITHYQKIQLPNME